MSEHHSLDQFGSEGEREPDPEMPDPTYRWDPEGNTCGSCGETVTALWVGEYGMICASCKDW